MVVKAIIDVFIELKLGDIIERLEKEGIHTSRQGCYARNSSTDR
jgi:hypothetical protein